ncbi:hypothetical protein SUGI_0326410 [Cryptomeria japonica]|nr:hypothetical protein SUGI_0326410 [Cryptomeria japonica]
MPSTKGHHKLDDFYVFLYIRFPVAILREEPEIVVRSAGHSYEGLSSTSDASNFAVIDFINFDRVTVDMRSKTEWAEAGATVGQLYSDIASNTADYSFPAGTCPTMGTGGHCSGGGMSLLSRKYGLAADNIIDALLVDANSNLLDRKSMGEDLFWALRGGGGGSWGVVVAWKVGLVRVPSKVTVFMVFMAKSGGLKDIKLTFNGMYLGPLDQLLKVANKSFPEMGMVAGDCVETSWIDSISYTAGTTTDQLVSRNYTNKHYLKAKSDFVTKPLPASALEGAWEFLGEELNGYVIIDGGFMHQTYLLGFYLEPL